MSKTLNKISAIGLSLTTVVWLSGAAMLLPVASVSAATAADIQAQINALLATIQALQAQLGTTTGGSTSAPVITRDLTVGSKGTDVTALQNFLMSQASAKWPSGQAATGYFGSLTKVAVANYQAAVGISPAAGYFGAKSRAHLATLGGGTGTTTGGVVVTAPATGLSVSLAYDNPVAGSLISGAARVEVLKLNLTAGNSGAATINTLKFTKTGVLSDTAINNAYLIEGGKVVTQFSSISGGVITFSGLNLGINAGQTRTFTLGIDPSTGLTAGNTVSFALMSSDNITSVDSSGNTITEAGNFPLNGNTMTVTTVSNPSIATLTIASSSVGTTVYAGTPGVLISQWTLTGANSKVNLKSIKFSVIGSAAKSDIQSVKLMINGVQVGSTLTSVASDGSAYFDLTSAPAALSTGSSNMQIYADIMGSPSFNFDFGILNSFDVNAVDATYNAPISVTVTGGSTGSTSGHQITINQGATTVTAASDTPTGYVAKGGSGTTLAKFNIYAAGEAMKVKYIDLTITAGGRTDWATLANVTNELANIALVDNAGGQIGSTISAVTSGATSGACTLAASSIVCHFGVTASPINYIIPANTTRTIFAKADIQSTATSTTFTASLPTMTGNNLLGMTSSAGANSGAASGAALSLSSSPLTAAINSGFGNVTYAKGTANAKIGSFTLTASAAEGINISNLTITMNASSTNFQNLLVKVAGVQIGSTKSTLSGSDIVTFSGAINIPVGTSKVIDVYADTLSSVTAASSLGTLTTLSSCTGTGATTNSSLSCAPTSIAGQSITISSGPNMSVALSSATAPLKQVVMGSSNNSLATFRFTETTNVEPIKISQLIVTATSTNAGNRVSFQNAKLYNGTTLVGGPVNGSTTTIVPTSSSSAWAYIFNLATPVIVPQNGSLELELKGDVGTNSSASASSSALYVFKIASTTTDITAVGGSSNTALTGATMTLSATPLNANNITTVRSKLTLSAASLGATSARTRTANDDVANLTFTADTADPITVNSVTLKFQGMAVSTGTTVTADLIDPSTGTDWNASSSASCVTIGNSCSVIFSYKDVSIPTISAGTSKTIKVRIDSTNFYNAASAGDSLSVFVNTASTTGAAAGTAISWGDGTTTNGLYLESTAVPITIYAGSYE